MSKWENASGATLSIELHGPGKPVTVIEAGGSIDLTDEQDYVAGTLTGPGQLVKAGSAPAKPAKP